jgi:hypothetical protein
LILRVVHAASLTPNQRTELVSSAKASYAAQQDAARVAVKEAEDPYGKAVAEFAVAHAKAVLKLLDAVPTG